jgi:hypothetical protein
MQYDSETKKLMEFAVQDLQKFMMTAGRDTTEASITAWQAGYIAGVQRASTSLSSGTVENYE